MQLTSNYIFIPGWVILENQVSDQNCLNWPVQSLIDHLSLVTPNIEHNLEQYSLLSLFWANLLRRLVAKIIASEESALMLMQKHARKACGIETIRSYGKSIRYLDEKYAVRLCNGCIFSRPTIFRHPFVICSHQGDHKSVAHWAVTRNLNEKTNGLFSFSINLIIVKWSYNHSTYFWFIDI